MSRFTQGSLYNALTCSYIKYNLHGTHISTTNDDISMKTTYDIWYVWYGKNYNNNT